MHRADLYPHNGLGLHPSKSFSYSDNVSLRVLWCGRGAYRRLVRGQLREPRWANPCGQTRAGRSNDAAARRGQLPVAIPRQCISRASPAVLWDTRQR